MLFPDIPLSAPHEQLELYRLHPTEEVFFLTTKQIPNRPG